MVDYNLLRSKIIAIGYSQNTFAKAVGMSPQRFSSKMTGRTRFSADEIFYISKSLALDKDTTWAIFFNHSEDELATKRR